MAETAPHPSSPPAPAAPPPARARTPGALAGLLPFLRPYRGRIALALLLLAVAAATTLVFPLALRGLVDGGLAAARNPGGSSALTVRFLELFAVAVVLGLASAGRFYMVSWLG